MLQCILYWHYIGDTGDSMAVPSDCMLEILPLVDETGGSEVYLQE